MRRIGVMLAWLYGASALGIVTPEVPAYECSDGEGTSYAFWIGRGQNHLRVFRPGQSRDLLLSGANVLRPAPGPGLPLVYNGWNPTGKTVGAMLDLSSELAVQFQLDGDVTRVRLTLVLDHQEKLGLECRSLRYAVPVVAAAAETAPEVRYADLLVEGSKARERDGRLSPLGVASVETALRRMASSPSFRWQEARDRFVQRVAPAVRAIEPRSLLEIEARLPREMAAQWRSLQEKIQYKYYPESERFATWIEQGAAPLPARDPESVIAGFTSFGETPAFRDAGLKKWFAERVTPLLKGLSESEATSVKIALPSPASGFFWALWSKAIGRRTLDDVPEVRRLARDLTEIVSAPEVDPQVFEAFLNSFLHSALGADPETRALFVAAAGGGVKTLTPRQREDVLGWLEQSDERAFFRELLQ